MVLTPLRWVENRLEMLDQRILPTRVEWLKFHSSEEVAQAIRGAPAIGIAAAYGMALAAFHHEDLLNADHLLRNSRPTAVNLFWALDRIKHLPVSSFEVILAEARNIEREDLEMNLEIGYHGAKLIHENYNVMTLVPSPLLDMELP
jgi:methylthioribose-1-phosphate isomerase